MALWHCVSGACYHLYSIVFIRPCVCVWFTYIKNYILIWERRKKKHNQNEWEKNKKNTHGQAESNRALFQNVFVLFSKYNSKSRYTFFFVPKKERENFLLGYSEIYFTSPNNTHAGDKQVVVFTRSFAWNSHIEFHLSLWWRILKFQLCLCHLFCTNKTNKQRLQRPKNRGPLV